MQIFALPKIAFDQMLTDYKVTEENVDQQEKLAFISINNHERDKEPYFKKDHPNVKVIWFDDVSEDIPVESVVTPGKTLKAQAFTVEQAKELYTFIKANKHRHTIFVHCTAGVARSGAVAVFINDFISGNWETFKRHNASIQPNAHVYRLLHDEWYKDHSHNDSITGEKLNSLSKEQEIESIVVTDKFCKDDIHYGINGQYFLLPLSEKFQHGDVIASEFKDLKALWVTNEPIEYVEEQSSDGTKCEYWVHTVKIATNSPCDNFYPRKFLLPGTRFHKLPTFNDSRLS